MVNPKHIFYVRQELNDVPEEYISDEAIYRCLVKAETYINQISTSTDQKLVDQAIISLATYYAYLDYISVVARGMRSVPEFSEVKLETYKQIALNFIRQITDLDVDDNFNATVSGASIVAFDTVGAL